MTGVEVGFAALAKTMTKASLAETICVQPASASRVQMPPRTTTVVGRSSGGLAMRQRGVLAMRSAMVIALGVSTVVRVSTVVWAAAGPAYVTTGVASG